MTAVRGLCMIGAWRFALTVDKRLEKNMSFVLGVDKHNVLSKAKTSDPQVVPLTFHSRL